MSAFWPIAVVLALAGGGALGLIAHRRQPVYRAEAHLLVSFPSAESPTAPRDGAADSDPVKQRRVKTYAGMLDDRRLTEPVIRSLRLPYSPEELGSHIAASSPVDTFAIDLAVTDGSAATAAAIANDLSVGLAAIAGRDKPSAELRARTVVTVVGRATAPGRPLPSRWRLDAVAGVLAGFCVGLGLAVVFQQAREGQRRSRQGDSA